MTSSDAGAQTGFEDELDAMFPGCSVAHEISLTTDDLLTAVIQALQSIQSSGGSLESLALRRRGCRVDHSLKVVGLQPVQTRALCQSLAATDGVTRVRLEHQIRRTPAPCPTDKPAGG